MKNRIYKAHYILVILTVLFSDLSQASNKKCATYLLEEGDKPFLRYVDGDKAGKAAFKQYKKNIIRAVNEVFIPWFENPSLMKYEDMLVNQNKAILSEGYNGFFAPLRNSRLGRERKAKPGKFRHDYMGNDLFHTPLHTKDSKLFVFGKPNEFKVSLNGIPEEYWPTTKVLLHPRYAGHPGPHPQHYHHYFQPIEIIRKYYVPQMEKLLLEAKNALNLPQEQFLAAVSDYYHLASNTHILNDGNNSLFMSHVNHLLAEKGMKPVRHGKLDYQAWEQLTYEDYRKVFIEHVLAEQ